jgi:hypothetical protein
MDRIWLVLIAIIIAGVLIGGRYTVAGTQTTVYIVDRFTGAGWYCILGDCNRLRNSN